MRRVMGALLGGRLDDKPRAGAFKVAVSPEAAGFAVEHIQAVSVRRADRIAVTFDRVARTGNLEGGLFGDEVGLGFAGFLDRSRVVALVGLPVSSGDCGGGLDFWRLVVDALFHCGSVVGASMNLSTLLPSVNILFQRKFNPPEKTR